MSIAEAIEKELATSGEWRILPKDALLSEKHRADLDLRHVSTSNAGFDFAVGFVYNDSRMLFPDGSSIYTSAIKDRFEIDGVKYIETRNTLYKII